MAPTRPVGLARNMTLFRLIDRYMRPAPSYSGPRLVQATEARKQQVRPRNQDILVRELGQQLIPGRRSRTRVDIEDHRELGMLECVSPQNRIDFPCDENS
jgi:hypothetical protein